MNRAIPDVSLPDVLDSLKRETMLELNCHAIGVVEKFNPSEQTCEIRINYLRTQKVRDGKGVYKKKTIEYPILLDCPLVSIYGGSAGMTMPVKKGDSCLVLFNDRDIDNWFSGKNAGELNSNRTHSISDGIALVGVRSLSQVLSDYDSENLHLYNGSTSVKLKNNTIEIKNSSESLGAVLGELIDAINAIATTNAVPGQPCLVSPASQASLTSIKMRLSAFLE